MIVRIPFKCPDALDMAIEYEANNKIGSDPDPEKDELLGYKFADLVAECKRKSEKWFRHSETVTLVIDFDEMTCTVEEV